MSFSHRENNLEKDDMNIKAHLDASLDMSNILMSEKLISRTLDAIKKMEQETAEPASGWNADDERPRYSWPGFAKGIASVAAALLILAVGINAFRMMQTSTKDDASSESKIGAGQLAYDEESADSDMLDGAESSVQFSTSSGDAAYEAEDEIKGEEAGNNMKAAQAPEADTETDMDMGYAISDELEEGSGAMRSTVAKEEAYLNFYDICPVLNNNAEAASISKAGESSPIMILEGAGIDELLKLFEGYNYIATVDMPDTELYTIDITGGGSGCTVIINEISVTVVYTSGNDIIEGSYSISNSEQLLSELKDMFDNYDE